MATGPEDFLRSLGAMFEIEAREHVQTIVTGLLELERTSDPDACRRLLESVFRAAHNLKGAARGVGRTDIESLCQSLEDAFAEWKRDEARSTPASLAAAHGTLDAISAALAGQDAPPAPEGRPTPAPAEGQDRTVPAAETVRIAVAKLDAHLLEAEGMLAAKLTSGQRAQDLRALVSRFAAWKQEWAAVQPDVWALRETLDRNPEGPGRAPRSLSRLLAFLDWNRDRMEALEGQAVSLAQAAEQDHRMVGKLVDDLLEESKRLLLLPVATLTASFPKLVHDLCRDQGKEAQLLIRGEDIQIDKRVLEEIKAPLIHILRNAVDHGIESPDERERSGKPRQATITVAAARMDGNEVELTVSDDGGGIDVRSVKASAVEHGVLPAAAAPDLSDAEAHRLMFESAVTTSPAVTRVSGRGLGLAIVRTTVEELGGSIAVESRPGRGTRFVVTLPATLATFRGILVEASQRQFVVPTARVERVVRVRPDEMRTIEGRDTMSLDERAVALVDLAAVLGLHRPRSGPAPEGRTIALVMGVGDQRVAFTVDAIHDEQEVLIKPLRPPLSRVRNVAGVTVLGSGRVAPILNVSDLLKSARGSSRPVSPETAPTAAAVEERRILVAEDSITSRMLLKNILESAGHRVTTVVDGVEAFTLLRTEPFDLVVSDVEMPRLNGFDLTLRIRADAKLADLPVVLVTALETRADRERGIDVGADAYIVKGSFDQSDLLDAIRRLTRIDARP